MTVLYGSFDQEPIAILQENYKHLQTQFGHDKHFVFTIFLQRTILLGVISKKTSIYLYYR